MADELSTLDRRKPIVRFVPQGATPLTEEGFAAHWDGFTVEESHRGKEPYKYTISVADPTGEFLRPEMLATGLALRVVYGYPDAGQSRDVFVKRVRGFAGPPAAGGRRARPGRAGSHLQLVCHPLKSAAIHRIAGTPTGLVNRRVSDVVRELFLLAGYRANEISVQQTEPILPRVPHLSDETPLQFIARQAKEHDFTWSMAQTARFGARGFDAPQAKVVRAFGWDDVLDWEFDNDLEVAAPSLVVLRGVNPLTGDVTSWSARAPGGAGGAVSGGFAARLAPQASLTDSDPRAAMTATVDRAPASAIDAHGERKALRRLRARGDRVWKLKLELVGDATLTVHSRLDLRDFGPWLDGPWYIRELKHEFKADGTFVTSIEKASRRAPGAGRPVDVESQDQTGKVTGGMSIALVEERERQLLYENDYPVHD